MLYSLIYKNPPFNKFRDTIEKISAIVDERHIIDFPATADPMVISVLKSCLDRNPRNRPSIEQLLSHPYLTCTSPHSIQPSKTVPDQLRLQLDPFIERGKLTEEAKVIYKPCVSFICSVLDFFSSLFPTGNNSAMDVNHKSTLCEQYWEKSSASNHLIYYYIFSF